MAKKTPRTYRLTAGALAVIESRDLSRYPTANDFVERRIMEAAEEKKEEPAMKELAAIRKELDALKTILSEGQWQRGGSPETEYELPVIGR